MVDNVKILVVDDELVVIRSCERVLEAEGYTVKGVLGGKEAILDMEQNIYDLVLTDLKMPVVDGIALIKWLRKSRHDTGIVVITGYPSQETIKEALELGIIDYVPKPFTPALLIDVTHRALEWMKGKAYVVEKPKREEFPPSMLIELERVIEQYRKKPGSTIPALQRAQEVVGYLPPVVQKKIAKGLNISTADIHSIVSFYHFFTMKPRGDHTIKVCLGTACYVKGIERVLDKVKELLKVDVGDATEDRKFSLETVRCLGACGLAPVIAIDQDTYGNLASKKVPDVLNQYAPAGAKEAPIKEVEGKKER